MATGIGQAFAAADPLNRLLSILRFQSTPAAVRQLPTYAAG